MIKTILFLALLFVFSNALKVQKNLKTANSSQNKDASGLFGSSVNIKFKN